MTEPDPRIMGDVPPDIAQALANAMNETEQARAEYEQAERQMRRATLGFLIAGAGLILTAVANLIRLFLPY